MKIIFQGLITHTVIDDGTRKQIAALIKADGHRSWISWRLDDVPNSNDTGPYCRELINECVSTNLGPGVPDRENVDEVPKLENTTTGSTTPTAELKACPPGGTQINAIFFLPPKGWLSAECFFDDEVKFNNVFHGPLPETVEYTVRATANVILTFGNGDTVELYPSAEILIANVCLTPGDHYQNYKNMYDVPANVTVYDPKRNGTYCSYASRPDPLPDCIEGSTLDIDCVNTRFP